MLPVRSIHPFIEYLDWCGWINCHIVRNWSSYCSTSCPWSWCHVLVCFIWATDRRWENCKLWGTLMHFPTQRITCCRRPFLGPLVHTSPYVMHNFFFYLFLILNIFHIDGIQLCFILRIIAKWHIFVLINWNSFSFLSCSVHCWPHYNGDLVRTWAQVLSHHIHGASGLWIPNSSSRWCAVSSHCYDILQVMHACYLWETLKLWFLRYYVLDTSLTKLVLQYTISISRCQKKIMVMNTCRCAFCFVFSCSFFFFNPDYTFETLTSCLVMVVVLYKWKEEKVLVTVDAFGRCLWIWNEEILFLFI